MLKQRNCRWQVDHPDIITISVGIKPSENSCKIPMLVSLSYLWLPSLLSRCERAFDIFTVAGRRAFGRFWHGQRRGFAHRLHLPKYVFSDMLPPTSGSCNCHGKVKCIFKSVTLGKPRIWKILYELNIFLESPWKETEFVFTISSPNFWLSDCPGIGRNIQWISVWKMHRSESH